MNKKNKLNLLINYKNYIQKLFPKSLAYIINGELIIKVPSSKIEKILFFLKKHTNSQYYILSDLCAVDYPEKKNRFELVYNLLSINYNSRITITTNIDEKTSLTSITDFHPSAGWFEREAWDMFGIFFEKNTDLRRILTDYGFKGHPLRKDFPLTGYVESRYSDISKRVVYEKVSLMQEYRTFNFSNNWTQNRIN